MPKARNTDPQTSHEAAASVQNITEMQSRIYGLLKLHKGLCDQQLIGKFHNAGYYFTDSGLRSRRAELVAAGLVKDSGNRIKLNSGRNSIIWEVAN